MAQLDLSVDPVRCFAERTRKAEDAARLVENGDLLWVPIGHTPFSVLGALAAREKELRGVKIRAALLPDLGWFRRDVPRALRSPGAVRDPARQPEGARREEDRPPPLLDDPPAQGAGRGPRGGASRSTTSCSASRRRTKRAGSASATRCWDAVSSVPAREAHHRGGERRDAEHVRRLVAPRLAVRRARRRAPARRSRCPRRPTSARSTARSPRTWRRWSATATRSRSGSGSHTGALAKLGAFDDANDLGYFGELTVPGHVDLVRRGNINEPLRRGPPGQVRRRATSGTRPRTSRTSRTTRSSSSTPTSTPTTRA